MSIPSNTNPKLAKMKKAARRKTTMDHRGAVFHALGCRSSSDFDRFMLFPKHDTTRPHLCAGLCKRRAAVKSEIRIQERGRGVLPGWRPDDWITINYALCATRPPHSAR